MLRGAEKERGKLIPWCFVFGERVEGEDLEWRRSWWPEKEDEDDSVAFWYFVSFDFS